MISTTRIPATKLSTMIAVPLLLLLTLLVTPAAATCEICGTGNELRWPLLILFSDGTKCTDVALRAASYPSWSEDCRREQYFWRNPCCGNTRPNDVAVTPTKPPSVPNQGSGGHPICDLCIGGGYPQNDNMVISLLYVGTGDCQMFYDSGLRGEIQYHMCDPLRYFAYEPCGCKPGQAPPRPGPAPGPAPGPSPGALPSRKQFQESKAGVKLSNQRGGAGSQYHGVRRALRVKGT